MRRQRSFPSRGRGARLAALALAAWLASAVAVAQPPPDEPPPALPPPIEPPPEPPGEVEVVKARVVDAKSVKPGHRKVRSVRVLVKDGGRVDWAQQGDWIAFDRPADEGFYHLYRMRPDGTRETCVTCNQWDFRKTHSLSPAFHPSGEFIAFQVQEHAKKLGLDTLKLTTPHRGLHSELWVITPDGRQPFKLTQIRERGGALVDPQFSHEGEMLAWSQRVISLGRWGEWEPHVGRFQIKRGVPRLTKVVDHRPAVQRGFVVAHGFTPDDKGLLLSAVPDARHGAGARDVLRFDLETGALDNLTSSAGAMDELAASLPRSDGFAWVSTRGIERAVHRQLPRQSDVWVSSESGRHQQRLTFFNDPRSDHFLGEALIDDLAWSPEGDRLLLHVVSAGAPGSGTVDQAIYLVELDGAL